MTAALIDGRHHEEKEDANAQMQLVVGDRTLVR